MLTEQNMKNRKNGIGASESAAVLGVCPYYSPYELWCIKTGRLERKEILNESQIRIRNFHEDTVAREYEARTGQKVRRVIQTVYHKDYPFLLCHLDRKIQGVRKLLECKSAFSFMRDKWGLSGTDEVPINYIIQVQHQLAVTGYEEGDLAVNIDADDYRIYHFKRDEQIINKIITDVSAFWKCVQTDTPPALRDRNDASIAYPYSNGSFKEADNEVICTIEKFREVREKAKQLENERKKLESDLSLYIKDSDGLKIQDQILATWKPRKDGVRVLKVTENRV